MLIRNFTLFFLLILSQPTFSSQILDLGNDLTLSYENGNLNKKTFNGFATDLSFFENGKLFGTIKTAKIDSQITDNDSVAINLVSFKGLTFFDEESDIKINIEDFKITDFNSEIFEYVYRNRELSNYQIENYEDFSFSLSGLSLESDDFNVKIDSIILPKIKYQSLSSGLSFAKKTTFQINGFNFTPDPGNMEMLPISMILAAIGQQSLNLDLFANGTVDDMGLTLQVKSKFDIELAGAASIKSAFNYLVPLETYEFFYSNQSLFAQDIQSQNFEKLNDFNNEIFLELGKVQLSNVNFRIQDMGILNPLLLMYASSTGVSEKEALSLIDISAQGFLSQFIPSNAEKFSESLSQFLVNGGFLELEISPPNPLPLMSIAGLLVMPDLAIEALGISLEHKTN